MNGEGLPGGTTLQLANVVDTLIENNSIGTTPDGLAQGSLSSTVGIGFQGENHDTTIRGNRPGTRSLLLDAVGFRDVEVSGPEQWRYDGERIHLTWTEPFAVGEIRTLEVHYAIESPVSGMQFLHPDEAYPDRPLLGDGRLCLEALES